MRESHRFCAGDNSRRSFRILEPAPTRMALIASPARLFRMQRFMLQGFEAIKELPVGIFDLALDERFIRLIKGMFEIVHPDHQLNAFRGCPEIRAVTLRNPAHQS